MTSCRLPLLAVAALVVLLAASATAQENSPTVSTVCENVPESLASSFNFLSVSGNLGTSEPFSASPGSTSLTAYGFTYPGNNPADLASGNYGANDMGLGIWAPDDKELNFDFYIQLDLATIQSNIVPGSKCRMLFSSAEDGEGVTPGWGNTLGAFGTVGADVVSAVGPRVSWDFDPATNRYLSLRGAYNGAGGMNVLLERLTCCLKPGGSVVGDPQFVGLRGQNYQVHGVSGEVYNIVSDGDLQYNSRFVFLSNGDCPVVEGRKQKSCWSHPGSYLGELGLKTRAGDKIRVISGPAKVGFETVMVNDKELLVGDTILLSDNSGSVSRNTTHLLDTRIGNWQFVFENSDMFVNQRVRVMDARRLRSHGLLGQTWRETTYPNSIKYIAGQVDDYVIRDNDLFGDSFVYNNFN